MAAVSKPQHFVQDTPNFQSVELGGVYINVKALADHLNVNNGYVYRVVNGERNCSMQYGKRIAEALGMTVDDLMNAITLRKHFLYERRKQKAGVR